MIDFLAIGSFDIYSRQLIAYVAAGVLLLLMVFFVVVLALKIKAAQDEKKSEILPSLAELGYEDEEEPLADTFDEESEDDGVSAFYEDSDDEEQAIEHFLDR